MPAVDLRPFFQLLHHLPEPPLVWRELFGNDRDVELEVGSGRGLFLLRAGMMCPERNFCGVEYDMTEARRAAARLQKRNLLNTRVIAEDARLFMPHYILDESVVAVHVYFPDPWWKRRHHKRRMFDRWFADEVYRVLVPGGVLHSWTDVPDYLTLINKTMRAAPGFSELPPPDERQPSHDMDYQTSFERKKRKLGLPVFRTAWRRDERSALS